MDIHVKGAQLDKYLHQLTYTTAISHNALENIPSEQQLMLKAVESAKIANGQDIFQTTREQDVS